MASRANGEINSPSAQWSGLHSAHILWISPTLRSLRLVTVTAPSNPFCSVRSSSHFFIWRSSSSGNALRLVASQAIFSGLLPCGAGEKIISSTLCWESRMANVVRQGIYSRLELIAVIIAARLIERLYRRVLSNRRPRKASVPSADSKRHTTWLLACVGKRNSWFWISSTSGKGGDMNLGNPGLPDLVLLKKVALYDFLSCLRARRLSRDSVKVGEWGGGCRTKMGSNRVASRCERRRWKDFNLAICRCRPPASAVSRRQEYDWSGRSVVCGGKSDGIWNRRLLDQTVSCWLCASHCLSW